MPVTPEDMLQLLIRKYEIKSSGNEVKRANYPL